MQTVRRKKPKHAPFGDRQALCAYCGVMWYRFAGRMGVDRAGQLSCKDCRDYEGRDAVTLSQENALAASRPFSRRAQPIEGANYERTCNIDPGVHFTSGDEFEL